MTKEKNILIKSVPFLMAILLPSIDYTNNPVHDNILIPLTRWFLLSSVLLLIWYLNHFISRWKPLKIIAINLTLIGFLFLLTEVFTNTIWDISFFPKIFLPIILFIAIQQSFQALEERKNLINENLSLKSETYKAELENLRNQINPHFLFNSLATLQSLIREKPNIAEDYLIKLSDFYRTTLISSKTNKVTLVEELNFIESYIFLLQNRFEKSLDISVQTNAKSLQYSIPIFSLQLLIENCIKHNIAMDESPLSIRIFQKNETTITVKNNLQPKQQKETSTKTGLSNLRKRYELMGIENGVSVYQNETLFSVTLKLF